MNSETKSLGEQLRKNIEKEYLSYEERAQQTCADFVKYLAKNISEGSTRLSFSSLDYPFLRRNEMCIYLKRWAAENGLSMKTEIQKCSNGTIIATFMPRKVSYKRTERIDKE